MSRYFTCKTLSLKLVIFIDTRDLLMQETTCFGSSTAFIPHSEHEETDGAF
jgi:hypothetical protein